MCQYLLAERKWEVLISKMPLARYIWCIEMAYSKKTWNFWIYEAWLAGEWGLIICAINEALKKRCCKTKGVKQCLHIHCSEGNLSFNSESKMYHNEEEKGILELSLIILDFSKKSWFHLITLYPLNHYSSLVLGKIYNLMSLMWHSLG